MARKAIQLEKVQAKVEAVALDAAHLITVTKPIRSNTAVPKILKGAIVRLRPGADWDDDTVRETRDNLESIALKVVVLPRPKVGVVLATTEQSLPMPSVRDVVLQMVRESGSEDRDALGDVVESVMAGVGL